MFYTSERCLGVTKTTLTFANQNCPLKQLSPLEIAQVTPRSSSPSQGFIGPISKGSALSAASCL